MEQNIIFGAAYYKEYLPEDRMKRDFSLMHEAGMNTVRIAESTWSVEEPRCGEFDFSHITAVIGTAARYGLNVIVGTPTYAIPKWLADLDPEILGNNAFGSRQNMDITNPTYRFHAERIIRELVSRTAGYENVIGYQIDNETKHYGVNNARVLDGFRAWLRSRFGTIEALNAAYGLNHWSCSVVSFEELPDPDGAMNASYGCAFEEYRRELASDFLGWQAEIVREYKRDNQFITHNFDYNWQTFVGEKQQGGQSAGLQPDLNDYEAAKHLTIAGTDIYCPPGDALTGLEIAFGGDLIRSLKKAPYLVLESQAQAFTGWLPYPGQLRLMALTHLAFGAGGMMYWPWLSIHNGIESYWKGVLSHDGEPNETYDEVSQIGRDLHTLAPLLNGQDKRNRIAMIVSPEALHALRWFPTQQDQSYNDVVRAFYRALYELNLECDVLYDRQADWSGYDLIVFPELYCCSDDMIRRVRAFVEKGGSVLAGFRSFFADEHLKIRHDRQPHGLTDVFGMHYSRFTRDGAGGWMELLEPDTAEVLAQYDHPVWGSYAAATHHRFGKGHAWYLGSLPEDAVLRDHLLHAAQAAGIVPSLLRWPILDRKRGKLRFLMNYSSDVQTVSAPIAGRNALTGEKIAAGDAIGLTPWGAAVLLED